MKQIRQIYNYVMKRWQGKSPEEANKEVEDESAGQPIPPQQPPPPPPHEEKGQQQSGSGLVDDEDDGGGVQLTTDEMIRVPQGDRYKVFAHPCQLLIAGATKSGKTTLLMKILAQKEIMFDPVPRDVYWFYTMRSSVAGVPESLPFVRLRNGVPTEDMVRAITKEGIPKMVILDDMQDVLENKNQTKMLMDILTKVSHHGNLSIVFIVQNLYNENMRKVRSQCDEIVIMGNGSSAMHNAEQMGRSLLAGKGAQYLKDCLSKARLLTPHSHLLVSSGAHTGPFSVRCGILPGDKAQAYFLQKGTVTTPEYDRLKRHGEEGEKAEAEAKRRRGEASSSAAQQEGGRVGEITYHGPPEPVLDY